MIKRKRIRKKHPVFLYTTGCFDLIKLRNIFSHSTKVKYSHDDYHQKCDKVGKRHIKIEGLQLWRSQ